MQQNITELQKKQFFDDGYIILKDFFSHEDLQKIETAFIRMYAIQASKILEYRKSNSNLICEICKSINNIEIDSVGGI